MYWIGYLARFRNPYEQGISHAVYKHKILRAAYPAHRTMRPELAIERLKKSK